MDTRNRRRQFGEGPCYCLKPLIRIWGVLTAIVVSGVGVDIWVHGYNAGFYIIISSIVIFFLEIKWVLSLFIQLCTNNDHQSSSNCNKLWCTTCELCGGWRLSFPYVALGIALIIWPHRLWLSYVAGALMIMLAILRLFTIFKYSPNGKEDELLNQFDEHLDKCDNLSEIIIDDKMPEPGQSLEDEALDDDDDLNI